MKKSIVMIVAMTALTIGMATPALAAPAFSAAIRNAAASGPGYGLCSGGYGLMWDQDGNFLDPEAFEATLDALIEEGFIDAGDRDYYLEQYDWCAAYGGGTIGVRRGCGNGRGMGRRW